MNLNGQTGVPAQMTDAARWAAVQARQEQPDLFYAVTSTKVFCRTGCRSRLPQRRNVVFFASASAALAAGFRACKRCQPTGPTPEAETRNKLKRACSLLEQTEPRLKLREVARLVGMSPFHFHRQFTVALGLTPKQYQAEHRLERFRGHLRRGGDVTSAIYEAGFGSPSRAYEQVSSKLGMSPGQYRNGGVGQEIFYEVAQTALGLVLVAATAKGVCAVALGQKRKHLVHCLEIDFPNATLRHERGRLSEYIRRLRKYAAQPHCGLELPLDLAGTAFQRRVWAALRKIPAGHMVTYQKLARQVGKPKAVRAVGRACAANKVALGVPCHRVVRSDGSLGGYRWGRTRKETLLKAERGTAS